FPPTVSVAKTQIQQKPWLETTEGTGINISCSHGNIQANEYIFWYRQHPGQGPEIFTVTVKASKELPNSAGHLLVSADRQSSALYL
ncbi:TVA4 protein, partial [Origma solitaria]|nr:TVA4 protein [Origma solitaria]